MNPVQEKMVAEMGIGPQWKLRTNSYENQILPQVVTPMHFSTSSSNPSDLSAQIEMKNAPGTESSNSTCQICGWCPTTSNAIASEPSSSVNYLFIHEQPSASGKANATVSILTSAGNALLNGILRELRIELSVSAYLAGIVTTKPIEVTGRRINVPDGEIWACMSCVKKQIELLRPSVIISLGNIAAISLLDLEDNATNLRGTMYRYQGTPLIVTHELDYLLQNPKEKRSLWSDLCCAMNAIQIH